MIKYLGSKRRLLPLILSVVDACPGVASVLDLFSGTSRVGHALKASGRRVIANDHNAYAEVLARCHVQADAERWTEPARALLAELDALPGVPGYVTETFCSQARYFRPENGARIDAIRQSIAERELHPELEALALTALMEAADKVDSTTGVQMAYLKSWAPRAHNELRLRLPELLSRPAAGACEAHGLDALEAADRFSADLVYLDPPYNQHKYLGNYHVWETLVRWDAPPAYGVARKREDCRQRSSAFNSRPGCKDALAQVINALDCRHLLLSFNDEGHLSHDDLLELLLPRGQVQVISQAGDRYVGAKIGIHNPAGRKVGTVGRLRNTEWLFLVSPEPVDLSAVRSGA